MDKSVIDPVLGEYLYAIEKILGEAIECLPDGFMFIHELECAKETLHTSARSAEWHEGGYYAWFARDLDAVLRILAVVVLPRRAKVGKLLHRVRNYLSAFATIYFFNTGHECSNRGISFDASRKCLGELSLLMAESAQEIEAGMELQRTAIPPKLRFSILERDNSRCQICGRDATDGVTLEIDHKIPVSKGGSNDVGNLQVLCRECNIGKSDSLM